MRITAVGRTSDLTGARMLADQCCLVCYLPGAECIRLLQQGATRQHDRRSGPWAAQVFRKLGFVVRHPECEAVASAQPGAVERVLKLLRLRLEEYGELHPPTGCFPQSLPAVPSTSGEAFHSRACSHTRARAPCTRPTHTSVHLPTACARAHHCGVQWHFATRV